jgi:hypothetical protein
MTAPAKLGLAWSFDDACGQPFALVLGVARD